MSTEVTRRSSRGMLACVAVGAAVLNQFLLLFPVALMFGVPTLLIGNGTVAAGSVVGFLIIAWLLQPHPAQVPTTLARSTAPDLYRAVDDLARRLNAPSPHAIALDNAPNAAAMEVHRGLSLRPTRRILVIGRPLLAMLDPDALAAVIAHELGHFSRQHGRLGHWLYRTRLAWIEHLESAWQPDPSPWQRSGAAFAKAFVPWFSRATFAEARRDEYEADAVGAQACGVQTYARTLQQVHVLISQWESASNATCLDLQRELDSPPANWLDRVAGRVRETASGAAFIDAGDDADPLATHPSLGARLRAFGMKIGFTSVTWPTPDACAGAVWLGSRWDAERLESRWTDAAARHAWRCWHALRNFNTPASCRTGPEAEQFDAAIAQLTVGVGAGAKRLLQQLLDTSPAWAAPVRKALRDHAAALGLSAEERADNDRRLRHAHERQFSAAVKMVEARRRGEFDASPLRADARRVLSSALACHPLVQAAWCVGLTAQLDTRRRYRGIELMLRIDPKRLAADAVGEDELIDSLDPMLAAFCEADVIAMIHLRYTTERVPEEFAGRPEAMLFEHGVTTPAHAAA